MTTPFGELTVIVNPHAGKRHVGEEIPDLERTLRARNLPYRLLRTQGPGDATRFAREALESGGRFLVAVGGDGTVHEVVNGMFDDEGKPIVPDSVLGVVAAGSGCDLIRTFGLPGDATRACHHLTGDNTYPLDIGKISYTTTEGDRAVRYFVNVAEVGLGAAVAARADRMSPSLGRSKYFVGFWLTLPRFKLAEVKVVAGRKSYEGPAYLVVVGNAQYYGGGMKISPRSYPGDGVLDALVFKGPKSDAFTMLPKIYRGEHLPHDHVEEFRVRSELVVEADRPLPIESDGEVLGTTPVTFEVLAQPIQMKL
ncbi:MAG: diacylglycerol kinase family lipid kinase [Actinobacteria bacterium]|nr:diacylglycerol kinase family lipid kinase [Actinomycetota bacterium]